MVVSLISMGLLKSQGIELTSEDSLMLLINKPEYSGLVKFYIGFNHTFIFILCPVLFLLIFYKNKVTDYLKIKSFRVDLLFLSLVLLFCAFPLMGYLSILTEKIEFPDWLQSMDKSSMDSLKAILKMNSTSDLMVNIFLIGVLPAIGEELLFRGIIQNELKIKLNRPYIAIVITAFVFSAFHFQVGGFLPKMLIGLILGFAYHLSNSIWVPVLIHFINNTFATLLVYFIGLDPEITPVSSENAISHSAALISFLLCVFLIYYMTISFKTTASHE